MVLYTTGRRGLRTSWLIVGMISMVPITPALPFGRNQSCREFTCQRRNEPGSPWSRKGAPPAGRRGSSYCTTGPSRVNLNAEPAASRPTRFTAERPKGDTRTPRRTVSRKSPSFRSLTRIHGAKLHWSERCKTLRTTDLRLRLATGWPSRPTRARGDERLLESLEPRSESPRPARARWIAVYGGAGGRNRGEERA